MHVSGGAVESAVDTSPDEVIEVGAEVHRFVVIGDDADGHAALLSFFEFPHDTVVGDGEDAEVEGLLGFANESLNSVQAIVAGAEVGRGFDLVFAGVEEFDDSLEPIERGDLAELIDSTLRQFKGQLAGFGLLDGIPLDFGEVGFEFLFFGTAEGEVFE